MARIQYRRGTAAQWSTANPVLAAGEPAYETDTGKQKIGNGSTAWAALPYTGGSGGATTTNASDLTSGTLPVARIADGSVAAVKLAFDPATQVELDAHATATNNPHNVTKAQVGLGNVPNVDATSRANHSGTQGPETIIGLASVATTGSYTDLTSKPTIPAATTDASALTSGVLPSARIADGSVAAAKLAFDVATQTELDAAVAPASRTVTSGTTLVLADRLLVVNSGTSATVTVPSNASVAYAPGTVVRVANRGAGLVTVVDAVTSSTFTTITTGAAVTLLNVAADFWISL